MKLECAGLGLAVTLSAMCAAFFLPACRAEAEVIERDQWFAAFMGDAKLGYGHLTTGVERDGDRDVGVVRLKAEVYAESFLGAGSEAVSYELIQRMDPTTLAPIAIESRINLGGEPSRTRIDFEGETGTWEVTHGGRSERGQLELSDPAALEADFGFLLQPIPTEERETSFVHFLSLQEAVGKVTPLTTGLPDGAVGGVKSNCSVGVMKVYFDQAGEVVEAGLPMGIRLQPETAEVAQDMGTEGYVPPINLGIGFGGKSDKRIDQPGRVSELTVVLHGLDAESVAEIQGRQTVEGLDDGVRVTVKADDVRWHTEGAPDCPMPFDDSSMLAGERFLDVDSAPVEAATRSAVGDETNSARAALKIAEWVNDNIRPGDFVGPIRSASSVLRTGEGVCRDYAALYVAMARRAGIPTRIALGLTYAGDGFYLHAWAESYVGQWVPVDPTRPQWMVDATHITLVRGTLADVWDTSRYSGALTIEIEDYRMDDR